MVQLTKLIRYAQDDIDEQELIAFYEKFSLRRLEIIEGLWDKLVGKSNNHNYVLLQEIDRFIADAKLTKEIFGTADSIIEEK